MEKGTAHRILMGNLKEENYFEDLGGHERM
jgi:hypothetical protein